MFIKYSVMASEEKDAGEKGSEKGEEKPPRVLDEEKSEVAVNTLLNQALSYMIDNGMVEMEDELRTLNVMN